MTGSSSCCFIEFFEGNQSTLSQSQVPVNVLSVTNMRSTNQELPPVFQESNRAYKTHPRVGHGRTQESYEFVPRDLGSLLGTLLTTVVHLPPPPLVDHLDVVGRLTPSMKWQPRIHSAPHTREPGMAAVLARVFVLT
jgi:hypothetical protein